MKIKIAQIPKKTFDKKTTSHLLASLCYHYPQYTLKQVKRMPYKDVVLLLQQAHREQAALYYNLTQIAAAPHSEKGKSVKKLLNHFKDRM